MWCQSYLSCPHAKPTDPKVAAMKLRLGVIGAGSWAVASHLPVLAARGNEVDFVGVCRTGADELAWVRDKFGFAMASERHQDVLGAGVDIVVVASPANVHYEHARDALLAGAHVLVEKPFTLTASQAWDLVDLAARTDRHLLVAFGFNYLPLVRAAVKSLRDQGGVGELESLSISMASVCRELLAGTGAYPKADAHTRPQRRTWSDPAVSGGGYAQAQLSHALGLGLLLFDASVSQVLAKMTNPLGGDVEQHCAAVVHWSNGAIGTVTGNATHEGAENNRDLLRVHAVGGAGQFSLEMDADCYRYYRAGAGDVGRRMPDGAGAYNCVGPPNALVDLALGRAVENLSPGWLGARTVEVVEALYTSARTGRPVPTGDDAAG
jgi:predicted dehydrogenase